MLDIRDLKSADDDSEKIMWLTEDEFENLLYIILKAPILNSFKCSTLTN